MKRTTLVACALLCVVAAAAAQDKRAAIVFDSQTKDFGRVLEGEPLKHVFRFTNKGDATLEILDISKP
jgi:Protein of unknown function (DUF1573)